MKQQQEYLAKLYEYRRCIDTKNVCVFVFQLTFILEDASG